MIIINHKENTLSIVHKHITDQEEKGYLIEAIVDAIRWNSLADDDRKYNVNKVDATNVYTLAEILKRLYKAEDNEQGARLVFKSTSPSEDLNSLMLAVIAGVRWHSLVRSGDMTPKDCNSLQILAHFLEQMVEVEEIK
jgi:hypothetical protein